MKHTKCVCVQFDWQKVLSCKVVPKTYIYIWISVLSMIFLTLRTKHILILIESTMILPKLTIKYSQLFRMPCVDAWTLLCSTLADWTGGLLSRFHVSSTFFFLFCMRRSKIRETQSLDPLFVQGSYSLFSVVGEETPCE